MSILNRIVNTIWYLILLNLSIVSVEAQTSKSTNGKMQVFSISENVSIHTRVYGEGPPIIMLPGLAGSGIEQFAEMGVKISENGYTVVLVDPRGVGNSSGPLDSLSLHQKN